MRYLNPQMKNDALIFIISNNGRDKLSVRYRMYIALSINPRIPYQRTVNGRKKIAVLLICKIVKTSDSENSITHTKIILKHIFTIAKLYKSSQGIFRIHNIFNITLLNRIIGDTGNFLNVFIITYTPKQALGNYNQV